MFGGSKSSSLAAQVTPTVTAAPVVSFAASALPQVAALLPLLAVGTVAFFGARMLTGRGKNG